MIFSIVYSLLEKGILGDYAYYPSTGNPYTFNLEVPALVSFIVGVLIGLLEVLYLSKLFIKASFRRKIILKTAIYFGVLITAIFIIAILRISYNAQLSPFHPEVINNLANFFSSFALWSVLLYFTLGLIGCLFYSEISDNLGQYVILNFFTGKYHKPIEEERIFMFLDMKSSTTIAEKLGHVKYFGLLNTFYNDLSDAIVKYGGEIYQYVGDEIVITWKFHKKSNPADCIQCFFAMQEALSNKSEQYLKKYKLVPTFKAGIHLGTVTTGEIGKLKKDFVFTGDILNTTARIQGLCNAFKVNILVSKNLVDALQLHQQFNFIELGETQLRGKDKKITLYSIK